MDDWYQHLNTSTERHKSGGHPMYLSLSLNILISSISKFWKPLQGGTRILLPFTIPCTGPSRPLLTPELSQ